MAGGSPVNGSASLQGRGMLRAAVNRVKRCWQGGVAPYTRARIPIHAECTRGSCGAFHVWCLSSRAWHRSPVAANAPCAACEPFSGRSYFGIVAVEQ